MSNFGRLVRTSHSLTLAAMEEASRLGVREGDIDHLFLALVLSDERAGRTLRGLGITIDRAREAVHAEHAEQLAGLGIEAGLPEPGPIAPDASHRLDWTQRASEIIVRAGRGGRDGSPSAVLRELLGEPSGLVGALLRRLGTTPAEVLAALDRAEPQTAPARPRTRGLSVSSAGVFVPASAAAVVAFLADPYRVPEWDSMIESVEGPDDGASPDDDGASPPAWLAVSSRTKVDGKPIEVTPVRARRRLELLEPGPERVLWRLSYPDDPQSRPLHLDFALTPTSGGTQVTVTLWWQRHTGWRWLASLPTRPVQRFFLWAKVSQVGAAVSRAFRS